MNRIGFAVNIAGAAAILVVGTYAANSYFNTELIEPCAGRYPSPLELALAGENGQPVSPIELEAQFGRDTWGVIDNVEVVAAAKAPSPHLIQVKLYKEPKGDADEQGASGGAGFSWVPEGMKRREAACLSYNVLFPTKFAFSEGGVLPGLYGGDRVLPGEERSQNKIAMSSLVQWDKKGAAGIHAHLATKGPTGRWTSDGSSFKISRGKWAAVQQEMVLNTPGKANGIMRLWIDNELVLERKNVAWRHDGGIAIEGVAADFMYLQTAEAQSTSNKTEAVRITPFSVSWK